MDEAMIESMRAGAARGVTRIRATLTLGVMVCALVSACTSAGHGAADTQASRPAITVSYPGDADGARALVERLGKVGDTSLFATLRPATADYRALFEPDFAVRAERFYEGRLWASASPAEPLAHPEQTEVRIWKSTTEELRAWTPAAEKNFPGGYVKIKDQWKPGLVVYTWKYIEPGKQDGIFCNGLVYVNDHWAYFPKPWYVLDAS